MVFVKRDAHGKIIAVSQTEDTEFIEQLSFNSPELQAFTSELTNNEHSLMTATDLSFVRVVEDLVELLVKKNYILFTELPEKAQEKMKIRQELRGKISSSLDLLDDEHDSFKM